ncbi:MAG: hypothetical protein M1829_005373 [Trizodia sp. TS-e1964]|nr:MAG: hypothetical protein M1829_005373 [Trizodia sp. TS-e1964]
MERIKGLIRHGGSDSAKSHNSPKHGAVSFLAKSSQERVLHSMQAAPSTAAISSIQLDASTLLSTPAPSATSSIELQGSTNTTGAMTATEISRRASNDQVAQIPEGLITDTSLWDKAYDILKDKQDTSPNLIAVYEDILSRVLIRAQMKVPPTPNKTEDVGEVANQIPQHDAIARRDKLKQMTELGLKHMEDKKISTTLLGHEIVLQDAVANVAAAVSWAEALIKAAVKDLPYASLVMAGVSLVLPLLKNPTAAEVANQDGLIYVTSQMQYYVAMESLLFPEDMGPRLKADLTERLVDLYSLILEFQVMSIIRFYRSRTKNFFRGAVNFDGWEKKLQEVKDSDAVLFSKFEATFSGSSLRALSNLACEAKASRRALEGLVSKMQEHIEVSRDQLAVLQNINHHITHPHSQIRVEDTNGGPRQEPIILIPFDKNIRFVNREDIFIKLDHLLAQSSSNRSAAIWGLGGSGKTQVVLEYAYRLHDKTSCSIYWIHSDSEARFTQDYTKLATKAKISPNIKGQDLLRAVQEWIEQQKNWLLVLDNADDLEIFKSPYSDCQDPPQKNLNLLQYVPKARTGTVIWTSRDGGILGSILDSFRGVEVGIMSGQEAFELFQSLCGRSSTSKPSQEEVQLLDLLEGLPLAISQAAAYIRKTNISIKRYLKILTESESRQSKLLSQEFQDVYRSDVPNSVMHTWQISMKQIAKESPTAEWILNIIAFLDNKGIPFELIKHAARFNPNENKEEDEQEKEKDIFDENENEVEVEVEVEEEEEEEEEEDIFLAVNRLVDYSFLQCQRSDEEELPTYEQHRLVQLATRRTLFDLNKTSLFSGYSLKTMVKYFPNGTHGTWDACRKFLPHALKAIACLNAQDFETVVPTLLVRVGRYYLEQGQYNKAEQVQVQAQKLYEVMLGSKHPDKIVAMANLASTWRRQGRYNEAEQLYLEVLDLQKKALGLKHLSIITAMANLASTWWQQGRYNEAEQLYLEVLDLRKKALGSKHPDTITAMACLASTWGQQGRYNEAEQLYLEVLDLQKEALGLKHPSIITAMACLASTWGQQGRYNEAEQLELEVLDLRKKALGSKHPDTITAMACLASTWRQQGRYNEAEQLELEVLDLQKEALGSKHPDTISAMACLASTWWQQGRYNEAEQLYLEVLDLREKALGSKHPDTITAMACLASTWRQQGRYNEAEQLELEVLDLRKKALGLKHPSIITAMACLASTWRDQGRCNEAEHLQLEVVDLQKKVLGSKHPRTISAMGYLASIWRQQGRYNDAEQTELDVLELSEEVLGSNHPDTINAMTNLASTWTKQGRPDEAERLQLEVLEPGNKVLGPRHPDIIRAMADLASTWRHQGKLDEAKELLIKAIELRKEVLGIDHPRTLKSMKKLSEWNEQSTPYGPEVNLETLNSRPPDNTPVSYAKGTDLPLSPKDADVAD